MFLVVMLRSRVPVATKVEFCYRCHSPIAFVSLQLLAILYDLLSERDPSPSFFRKKHKTTN